MDSTFQPPLRAKSALVASFMATVLIGGAWIAMTWLRRDRPDQALLRCVTLVAGMGLIHACGYRLYHRQPFVWSPLYREALRAGVAVDVVLGFFFSTILTSGIEQMILIGWIAHGTMIGMILTRSPDKPKAGDVQVIKYGFPAMMILVLFAPEGMANCFR